MSTRDDHLGATSAGRSPTAGAVSAVGTWTRGSQQHVHARAASQQPRAARRLAAQRVERHRHRLLPEVRLEPAPAAAALAITTIKCPPPLDTNIF